MQGILTPGDDQIMRDLNELLRVVKSETASDRGDQANKIWHATFQQDKDKLQASLVQLDCIEQLTTVLKREVHKMKDDGGREGERGRVAGAICNIFQNLSCTDAYRAMVVDAGALPPIMRLLSHIEPDGLRGAAWGVFANLVGRQVFGYGAAKEAVVMCGGLKRLTNAVCKVLKEEPWGRDVTTKRDEAQVDYLGWMLWHMDMFRDGHTTARRAEW